MTALTRLAVLLAAAVLAIAVAAPVAPASHTGKAHAAKKCKKNKKRKKCRGKRRKKGPDPYAQGQPCNPAQGKAYARYGYLCLPQPQPDGSTQYQLVASLA